MKVSFQQFWPSFEFDGSFFHRALLEKYREVELVHESEPADLQFLSVFPSKPKLVISKVRRFITAQSPMLENQALINTSSAVPPRTATRRIWFTGENVRVPFSEDFDFSLSFDQDSYDGRNVYFPLWQLDLNWFEARLFNNRAGAEVSLEALAKPRLLRERKPKFACAFIGNTHPMRDRLISELSKIARVDVYGKSVGRPVNFKSDVSSDYKYQICLENDLYPGYVTEKLLEAYISGCVPIYWGDLGHDASINSKSFLNLRDYGEMSSFAHTLSKLSDNTYKAIYEQPFLRQVPDIAQVMATL